MNSLPNMEFSVLNAKSLCLLFLSAILFGCGSTTEVAQKTPEANVPVEVVPTETNPVEQIEETYQQTQDRQLAIGSLLTLANELQVESCNKTEVIVFRLEEHIQTGEHRALANLLKSECQLLTLLRGEDALDRLATLEKVNSWLSIASDINVTTSFIIDDFQRRLNYAQGTVATLTSKFESAIPLLITTTSGLNPVNSIISPYANSLLWQSFSHLSGIQKQRMIAQYSQLSAYNALLQIVEDSTLDDNDRQVAIRNWLNEYPTTSISQDLPRSLEQFLSTELSTNDSIAVLLPLSGRLSSQGDAIKQGVLAAYYQQYEDLASQNISRDSAITFIDTGSNSALSPNIDTAALSGYGVIIGPLLKSHVNEIDSVLLPSQRRVYLNQLSDTSLTFNKTWFALSPEQEATELAITMHTQGIKNPVLVYGNGGITERMRDAFVAQWQSLLTENQNMPAEVSFTDTKSMRVGITSALDVMQSEQRIAQMSRLTSEVVHSVTRNRRDIDGFVVFANPQEVEVVNPIIEASISLFSDTAVPVYATSYSYNHKQTKNRQRDLRNLVFIDMPFVQPQMQTSELANTVDELYNQPSSTFLRLFAFGYDALTIANNSLQLKLFDQVTKRGLTGELSVNKEGGVQRRLSSLRVQDEELSSGD